MLQNALTTTRRTFFRFAVTIVALAIIGVRVTGRAWAGVKDYVTARIRAVYGHDRRMQYRKSQDNPFVKKLYEDFLSEPCCEKSHELLHSHYTDRSGTVRKIKNARERFDAVK